MKKRTIRWDRLVPPGMNGRREAGQLAAGLGVTESYISKLLRDPGIRLSPSLAALVEERYGYRAQWLLTGQGPKLRQARGQQGELSELHQRALARLEIGRAHV